MRRAVQNFGYIPDPLASEKLAMASLPVYGGGDDLPRDMDRSAFPYRVLAQALRGNSALTNGQQLRTRNQGSHGSCVGHGTARMAACNLACDLIVRGAAHEWPELEQLPIDVSPSWVYGASRQIAGQLGRWEGSNGSWAVRALCEWGLLFERKYDAVDLSEYREEDCDRWELRGVPKASLDVASQFKFDARVRVENVEQWVGLIQNFYTSTMCSQLGFAKRRDEWGFAQRQGSWAHCMWGGAAYVAKQIKPQTWLRGILVGNSWPAGWIRGPKHPLMPDQPVGSFLMTLDDAQRALDYRDTWVTSGGKALVPAPRNWREGVL